MFVRDHVITYFDVKKTVKKIYQIWNKAHFIQSSLKSAIYDGIHWFWSGTHYFSWGDSQGLNNDKFVTKSLSVYKPHP